MGQIEKQCESPDSLCRLGWVDGLAARHYGSGPRVLPASLCLVWCPQLSPRVSLQGPVFGVGSSWILAWGSPQGLFH